MKFTIGIKFKQEIQLFQKIYTFKCKVQRIWPDLKRNV